jgi:iron complex outermembrane receptor protein
MDGYLASVKRFLIAFSSIVFAGSALAQEVDTSGRQLEEIQVFAQKKNRAESLQDVPAAITALNEAQLDDIVFESLTSISYRTPNASFEEIGTFPGVQNFTIRGQGINSSIPSVDPTVGTFVDGVYVGTTYGVVVDTWDLESVEILRGPQGLLFGRNVTGGAVLLRSVRPDPNGEFELKARAATTDADRQTYSVATGAPLIEGTLAARIMLQYDDDDGYFDAKNEIPGLFPSPPFVYFDQQTNNRDVGQLESKLARPSIVWTPTDEINVALLTEFGNIEGDGAAWAVIDGNTALDAALSAGLMMPVQAFGGQRDGNLPEFTTRSDEIGETDIDWTQATLEFNWDVFGGTLTNIAGYREVDVFATSDIDGTSVPFFTASGDTDQDQFSNELRFATRIDDRWDMTIGLYYLTQNIEYNEARYLQVNLATLAPSPPPPFGAGRLIAIGGEMDADTYGIFLNNDYALTDTWILNAGLRYSYEEKDTKIISGPSDGSGGSCSDIVTFDCQRDDLDGDWDNWMPKLGVQWLFAENAQAYAFWTQGYRTGGFNFRNARPDVIPPGPTQQEEQDSYEAGIKADLLDNRMRVNAAVFYNDIDNNQREVNIGDPDPNGVVVLQGTINAGDVTIWGSELELTVLPIDNLSFWGSVGYLNGEYDSKNPPWDACIGDPDPACTGTRWLGDELPRLAEWSYSLGASYDIPLNSLGLLNLRTDFGYRDKNPYDDANLSFFDSQKRLEAFASWFSPDEHWRVTVFGKNLLDEANYGNITSIAGLYTAGPMQRGREYGLQLEYRL